MSYSILEVALEITRRCSNCGQTKRLATEFHNDRSRPDGKTLYCRTCNNERSRIYAETRRAEDPLWNRAYFLEYQTTHRDYFNAYQAKWLSSSVTAQRNRAHQIQWRMENADLVRAYGMERRALKAGASVCEVIIRSVVAERDHWVCKLCFLPIDPNGTFRLEDGSWNPWYLHIDHIIPLSKGGAESYDNVQASHARCNLKKNARLLDPKDPNDSE